MTREEKIQILNDAVQRAYEEVESTGGPSMGTEDFQRLLHAIEQMQFIRDVQLANNHPRPDPERDFAPDEVQPEPEPEPEPETGISKEELRDKLSTYSNKYDSLDVAKIMAEMGYSRLSEIPATKYAELLAKVEAAVKEGA